MLFPVKRFYSYLNTVQFSVLIIALVSFGGCFDDNPVNPVDTDETTSPTTTTPINQTTPVLSSASTVSSALSGLSTPTHPTSSVTEAASSQQSGTQTSSSPMSSTVNNPSSLATDPVSSSSSASIPISSAHPTSYPLIDLKTKPVASSPVLKGHGGNKGTDGDRKSFWASDQKGLNPWYQIDLEGLYKISLVAIVSKKEGSTNASRTNLTVLASNDPTFKERKVLGALTKGTKKPNPQYPAGKAWKIPVEIKESFRYIRIQRLKEKGYFDFAEMHIRGEQTGRVLIAKAGKDLYKKTQGKNGKKEIALDGSLSIQGESPITKYVWKSMGTVLCKKEKCSYPFSLGTHPIKLIVEDEAGNKAYDTITVTLSKATPPPEPFKQIDVWEMAKKMGRGINMGNTLEAKGGEGSWAPAAKEYYFDDYKKAGFTNVRIPIHWGIRIDNNGVIDKSFMNRVEQIVDWSLSRGLVTIINTHHEEWVINNYHGNKHKLIKIWEQIAARFKDKSNLLVFELFNEPRAPMSDADVTDLNHALLSTVRKTNPKRIAIVTGGNWGNWQNLKNADWPNDPNVMASLHYYEPFDFSHEAGYSWSNTGGVWNDLDDILSWLKNTKGVPGFVGEFGVNHGKHSKDWNAVLKYYETVTAACNKWNAPYSVWDDHGWYKIYDRQKRTYNGIEAVLQ
ncbi:MAG: cellulase family glycosylhydrolase [Fibrobacterales bacterium]